VGPRAAGRRVHVPASGRFARSDRTVPGRSDRPSLALPVTDQENHLRHLRARLAIVLDDAAWRRPAGPVDRRHFRWQLEVEYLCAVRGLDLTALRADEGTWAELLRWHGRVGGGSGDV